MASLTDTLQQQTRAVVSETAQKRKKREAKEKVKNIAYMTLYDKFYKSQEEPMLIYLKYNNIRERQEFIDNLPVIYKIQNDYINEQEASEIYTKELNRLFKIFKENKKYIDYKDNEYLQQQEAEETEQTQEQNKLNQIQNTIQLMPTYKTLGTLGLIFIELTKIPLCIISFLFGFITELLKPYRRRKRKR